MVKLFKIISIFLRLGRGKFRYYFRCNSSPQAENFTKSRSQNAIYRGEIASKYRIFFGACGGPIIELLSNTTNYEQLFCVIGSDQQKKTHVKSSILDKGGGFVIITTDQRSFETYIMLGFVTNPSKNRIFVYRLVRSV